MASDDGWKAIVASSLDWEQAHASLDAAIKGLPADLRGKRPDNFPHSVWDLLDHIRRTQNDLLEFCRNPKYAEPKWPEHYWPRGEAPPDGAAWDASVAAFRRDLAALQRLAADAKVDLFAKIPHGTGQTYLRELILALDHNAYHIGELVAVRRLLGVWK